ncbi:hypothetical protein GC089_00900 [Cellulomonas sp. JZ18]|uniref:DUF4190 domain-containing protein n=1 Tax=Cellulomonas sp. JZ18 TaxID=2654191 RepID=UPI0012D3E6E8|nr:DUF4190 domain-containing protein [Cellulomonas sp. JZ18]QGQ18087.1 hypothetical protein GC089_00900 [Cellulomonas sp. JZ18]
MSTDDATAVRPAPGGTAAQRDPGPEPGGRGLAVAALVTALVAAALGGVQTVDEGAAVLAGVLAVIALVLGATALVDAVRDGRRGRGTAVTALVVSALALGLVLATQAGLVRVEWPTGAPAATPGATADAPDGSAVAEPGDAADPDDGAEDAAAAQDAAPPTTTVFGEPYAYPDGLSVTVDAPRPFEPSESADATENGEHVRVTVTVTNGTAAPYEPLFFRASASSGGIRATTVIDSAADLVGGPPLEPVPAGGTVSFDLGFTVSDPDAMVVELTAGGVGRPDVTVGAG